MLTHEAWAGLIPHADAMALLDGVVHWDATSIYAIGERHTLNQHPLRGPSGLHAVHLAEYGAQATAVHGALLGEVAGRAGKLVSLRDVQLSIEYVDLSKGRLDVHAERLLADERGAQYTFRIDQQGQQLASGRILVMYA